MRETGCSTRLSSRWHIHRDCTVAALLVIAVTGCNGSTPAQSGDAGQSKRKTEDGPYEIVTTCGMVTDIVRLVAGDQANVNGLIKAGVDPHLFTALTNDVKQLMQADVVFYSGLMLEGRMADDLTRVGRNGKPVYAVTEGIDKSFLREPPEFEGHWDPHVWMDVAAWSECVGFVAEALSEYDPAHKDGYRQRAAAYREELQQLDSYVREVIVSIPQEQRVLVTAHDAFGYFARAYDIPVESVQGLTTESEAGVADVNRLVDLIVERQLEAIFIESSVPRKNVEAVIEGAGQRDWQVRIGGELYSDAMGPAGSYEGTYIGMLDHNATIIARALGGEAPELGMQGKLSQADK